MNAGPQTHPPDAPRARRVVAIAFVLFAGLCLLIGLGTGAVNTFAWTQGEHAVGTVTGVECGMRSCRTRVEYTAADGSWHQLDSHVARRQQSLAEGDTVRVLRLPADQGGDRVVLPGTFFGVPLGFTLFGLLFAAIGRAGWRPRPGG